MILENVKETLHMLVHSKFDALRSQSNSAPLDFKIVSVDQPQLAIDVLLEVKVTLG